MGQNESKITTNVVCTGCDLDALAYILPIDVWCHILGYANNNGLSLKEYRNYVLVCKGFMHTSNLSVRSLNLIELSNNSPYRTCTLMSHIVREGILKWFPNLKTLHISFSDNNVFELHEKLMSKELEHKSLRDKSSMDEKLTEFDDDIKNVASNMAGLTEKVHESDIKLKDALEVVYIAAQGLWSLFGIARSTGTPLLPSSRGEKAGELYSILEKIIIDDCICALNLEKLHLHTCFATDLAFVMKMPNLRALSISAMPSRFSCKPVELHISCKTGHNLQKLMIWTDTRFTATFDELSSIFPDLKYLSMNMRGQFDYNTLSYPNASECGTLESFVHNFPHIEKLTITGLYDEYSPNLDARPLKYLRGLQKLQTLNVSNIKVTSDDLIHISTIPNLQKLTIPKEDMHNGILDWIHDTRGSYADAVKSFKLSRPDVNIAH